MRLKKLVTALSLSAVAIASSSSALATVWPYEGESGHASLSYSDNGDDITAAGFQVGYGSLTQSLGGWIWDATASYTTVDSAVDSEWGFSLSGDLGYRFANVVRGVDLDLLGGVATMTEAVEIGLQTLGPQSIKLETTWAKLGVGFYAQATPTTDIRFEMGVREALDISVDGTLGQEMNNSLENGLDEAEFRTQYAGLQFRFLNRARLPVLASLTASRADPYGTSNNALMFTIGVEF